MNVKIIKNEGVPVILIFLMIIFGLTVYTDLPEVIPVHWNIHGIADRYWKTNLLVGFLLPILAIIIYLFMILLPKIDPKRDNYGLFKKAYSTIKLVIICVFFFIYVLQLLTALGGKVDVTRYIAVGLSICWIVIGNVMGKIRQNRFVGIRLPWTLSSEEVWNKTHRLCGKLWVVAGIIGVSGIFFSNVTGFKLSFVSIMAASLIAVVYSALLAHRLKTFHG